MNKTLTKEIAESFLNSGQVNFLEFTGIEDAAAQALAQHNGDLELSGLTILSEASAEALSHHEGRLL